MSTDLDTKTDDTKPDTTKVPVDDGKKADVVPTDTAADDDASALAALAGDKADADADAKGADTKGKDEALSEDDKAWLQTGRNMKKSNITLGNMMHCAAVGFEAEKKAREAQGDKGDATGDATDDADDEPVTRQELNRTMEELKRTVGSALVGTHNEAKLGALLDGSKLTSEDPYARSIVEGKARERIAKGQPIPEAFDEAVREHKEYLGTAVRHGIKSKVEAHRAKGTSTDGTPAEIEITKVKPSPSAFTDGTAHDDAMRHLQELAQRGPVTTGRTVVPARS